MRSGNPGKKELINNLKTAPLHGPSPTRGGSSRCNTSVLRTNAGGGRPKTILKPKISIFAQFCGGNRFAFPTLQLNNLKAAPHPSPPQLGEGAVVAIR